MEPVKFTIFCQENIKENFISSLEGVHIGLLRSNGQMCLGSSCWCTAKGLTPIVRGSIPLGSTTSGRYSKKGLHLEEAL